ncbi:FAD binding domain-containing protein [Ancylobacter pratisalsi]|uniref:FAD-binding molybdopterin dehydrogenase n=1 Tax=Ancylobacter pratisalsi TaxID=1745854 RepID=A0A6P1YQX7_9HYPH|nr:FAD binding domain-containing protein [Ancylobacter pratisalsi]QIB34144.1 FAD-binding molybdopterin dehydrogenase [Ancylobacter pratisalsi]
MDLNTVKAVVRPRGREELAGLRPGDALLAGGTWLFSEPQPKVKRLIDLNDLNWAPMRADEAGLTLAATCTIATLYGFEPPPAWPAAQLIPECCRSFLASFKIWNMATVGGNICLSLPAGPMISLCAALDGICVIWMPDGSERRMSLLDFVRGPMDNALEPDEILRAVEIPAEALRRSAALRRASLTPLGRSGALIIGTRAREGAFALTVTAATRHPVRIDFDAIPGRAALMSAIDNAIPDTLYYDDIHGRPDWRRHMTRLLAEEVREELMEAAA